MELIIGIIIFIIVLAFFSIFTIDQQTSGLMELFGKFTRVAQPGLNFKIPFFERVAGRVSLRVRQLDVKIETKTKDNVFVNTNVSVQFFVRPEKIYEAFYALDNPEAQIRSYVFDVVRAEVPKITLDDLFEKKDDIALAVKRELEQTMENFGYGIVKALVTDIDPDATVKESMNAINAAERMRYAAVETGEADKIIQVKAAEAEAESKRLSGIGIADQRQAIINGLKESVEDFRAGIPEASAMDVMNVVLITQYFDMMKDIGASSNSNTILLPNTPSLVGDLSEQIRNSTIIGNETTKLHGSN